MLIIRVKQIMAEKKQAEVPDPTIILAPILFISYK